MDGIIDTMDMDLGGLWELVMDRDACNAGDLGSIPGLGRSPGQGNKGNGNPFHYSGLEIPWTEEPDGLQSMG